MKRAVKRSGEKETRISLPTVSKSIESLSPANSQFDKQASSEPQLSQDHSGSVRRSLPSFRFLMKHFRDQPELWFQGIDADPPPTLEEVIRLRKATIERLRRAGGRFAIPMRRLAGCRPGRRCMSAACEVCTFALRRWCVGNVPDGAAFFVTIIDSNATPPVECLHEYSWKSLYELAARQLRIANVIAAIGAAHFDLIQLGTKTFWQPHLHFLVWGKEGDAIRESLKQVWKNTPAVYAAVDVRKFDGDPRCIAYAADGRHKKKIMENMVRKNGLIRARTKKIRALESRYRSELDAYLNEMTVWERLFVFGFEIEKEAPMSL